MTAVCDILMPVFNAEATVADAVRSLQHQSVQDLRIIIIDDGSAEPCAQLLRNLAAADCRIDLLAQSNAGIVAALNRGLERANAPLVARLDADDIAYPERLALQIGWLDEHPQAVAVSGSVRHIDKTGKAIGTYVPTDPGLADPAALPAREPYLIHPFLMVRRKAIVAAGGYRHVHHAEDSDLYWRLAEQGSLHNMPAVLGDYRLHEESISGSSIVNGRIMATNSQLAALSARRRRGGETDLRFDLEIGAYRDAEGLAAMVALTEPQLSDEERRWFRLAVATKLLELASYRPWPIGSDDIEFIKESWVAFRPEMNRLERRQLGGAMQRMAAKLLLQGQSALAVRLAGGELLPGALARAAKGMLGKA